MSPRHRKRLLDQAVRQVMREFPMSMRDIARWGRARSRLDALIVEDIRAAFRSRERLYHLKTKVRQIAAGAIVAGALAGCGHAPPKERIVVQTKTVPIYQPCDAKVSPPPEIPYLVGPIPFDIFGQMKAAVGSIQILLADNRELRAAVAGCAGAE